jgi:RNA polymerase sigma factor (sigma-70 family)
MRAEMNNRPKSMWIETALTQHEGALVRYATWILGDIERAREVVQETFLRLCKEQEFRVKPHLAQWLFTVCRNLALDVRRKENRMSPLSYAEPHPRTAQIIRPSAALEQQETLSLVLQIIETLPKNQREVMYLKFQSELSYKEISEITQLSITNIGFLIHTAVKTVRKEIMARRIQ